MGEKKTPGRFTVQFNLKDPQQRAASELLEQQGRRKAQFITSAVLHYIQQPGHSGSQPQVAEDSLERMLISFLEKHPQIIAAKSKEAPTEIIAPPQKPVASGSWDVSLDSDTMKAISETLTAFQME